MASLSSVVDTYSARIKFLSDGQVVSGSDLTVGEWFARWLEVVRETLRPTTAANYRYAYDRMTPYLGEVRLRDLNEDMIRSMYRSMCSRYTSDTMTSTHGRLSNDQNLWMALGRVT